MAKRKAKRSVVGGEDDVIAKYERFMRAQTKDGKIWSIYYCGKCLVWHVSLGNDKVLKCPHCREAMKHIKTVGI